MKWIKIILFISIKALSFFNYRYIIIFVCIVFFLRIAVFIDNPNFIYLKNIGNGDPLNLFLGLLQSITFLLRLQKILLMVQNLFLNSVST